LNFKIKSKTVSPNKTPQPRTIAAYQADEETKDQEINRDFSLKIK
jgi:hypothetical protein